MSDTVADTVAVTLSETLTGLVAPDDHRVLVAGAPVGSGWTSLAEAIASDEVFDGWFGSVRQSISYGRTDVTGSYLSSFLGDALIGPLGRAILHQQRAWRFEPATTWVRLADDGWFDGMATDTTVLVLPSDPAAGRNDVEVVGDINEMVSTAMSSLVEVLSPVFTATRARAPYGMRGMWSSLADSVASDATWNAHVARGDVIAAWNAAGGLIDALDAVAPTALTRPTFDLVEADGHSAHLTTRGTCCLYYRSLPEGTTDYCTSCPLGTEADRTLRRTNWLRRELADRADERSATTE